MEDSGYRVFEAINEKPDRFSFAEWGHLLKIAAWQLEIHFDEVAFNRQIDELTLVEDPEEPTEDLDEGRAQTNAELTAAGSEDDDEDDAFGEDAPTVVTLKPKSQHPNDDESISADIDILNDVRRELKSIRTRVESILNLNTKNIDYVNLTALDTEINEELLTRLQTVMSLLNQTTSATQASESYHRRIETLFSQIIEAESHIQTAIFDKAMSSVPEMKASARAAKAAASTYPYSAGSDNSGQNRPSKTKTRTKKTGGRTGGGRRTGKTPSDSK